MLSRRVICRLPYRQQRHFSLASDSTHGTSVTPGRHSFPAKRRCFDRRMAGMESYVLALLGMSETQCKDMFESWRAARHWDTLVCDHCRQTLDETEPVVFAYEEGYGSSAATLHLRCAAAAMPSMARTSRWLHNEPVFACKKQCVHCNREMIFGQRLSGLAKIKNTCTPYCGQQYRLRQRRVQPQEKICVSCKKSFLPRRNDAVTCSHRCRQRVHRQNRKETNQPPASGANDIF
jgi:hypothetical protein